VSRRVQPTAAATSNGAKRRQRNRNVPALSVTAVRPPGMKRAIAISSPPRARRADARPLDPSQPQKQLHDRQSVDVTSEVVASARRARRRIAASQLRRMASLPGRITSQ
jgi:hypothetical protein